jgi:AGZA family xanthine/uracil permease-like MFS transporter
MLSSFQVKKNNPTLQTELIAGISSFLATSYIIIVNPGMLSQTGMPFAGVSTATIIVGFCSSLMGPYARNRIFVALEGDSMPFLLIMKRIFTGITCH